MVERAEVNAEYIPFLAITLPRGPTPSHYASDTNTTVVIMRSVYANRSGDAGLIAFKQESRSIQLHRDLDYRLLSRVATP